MGEHIIRQYEERYKNEVEELLAESTHALVWGENANQTYLAIQNKQVIGIASLSSNAYHPNREYFGVYIKADFRRQGIGSKLFSELDSVSEQAKFQIALSSKEAVALSFLKSIGFGLVRKSFTPVLKTDNTTSKVREYVSLKELSDAQKEELVALQLQNYRDFHKELNPLSEKITVEKWEAILFNGIDWEHSSVLIENEKVEAYILCYLTEDMKVLEIGYVGGRDLAQLPRYRVFYKEAIDSYIHTFESVYIEADDVDPFAFAALSLYPYDESDSWDTYILN